MGVRFAAHLTTYHHAPARRRAAHPQGVSFHYPAGRSRHRHVRPFFAIPPQYERTLQFRIDFPVGAGKAQVFPHRHAGAGGCARHSEQRPGFNSRGSAQLVDPFRRRYRFDTPFVAVPALDQGNLFVLMRSKVCRLRGDPCVAHSDARVMRGTGDVVHIRLRRTIRQRHRLQRPFAAVPMRRVRLLEPMPVVADRHAIVRGAAGHALHQVAERAGMRIGRLLAHSLSDPVCGRRREDLVVAVCRSGGVPGDRPHVVGGVAAQHTDFCRHFGVF